MNDTRIVLSAAGSRQEAERIAHHLVETRLAACVNLVPQGISVYRWRGVIETVDEILMVIKTSSECLRELESEIERLHSYEVPEFLVLSVESGGAKYLEWMRGNLK